MSIVLYSNLLLKHTVQLYSLYIHNYGVLLPRVKLREGEGEGGSKRENRGGRRRGGGRGGKGG